MILWCSGEWTASWLQKIPSGNESLDGRRKWWNGYPKLSRKIAIELAGNFKGNMYKTVVYTVKTWNFVKRDSQKILLLTAAVQIFADFTKKHQYWSLFVIKWQSPYLNLYLKSTLAQMFFCEILKSTFFTQPLRVTTSGSSGRYL